MGEQSERVGVPLEMHQIGPAFGGKLLLQRSARTFGKEGGDGRLARMTEGGITQIVGKASRRHNLAYRIERGTGGGISVPRTQSRCHLIGHRPPHTGHLHAVGEPVVHKHTAREREHLGLVLEPAEG